MKKSEKIIELTKLLEKNLFDLERLKKEKEKLKKEYNEIDDKTQVLIKIKDLEKKYVELYKKVTILNEQIKKLNS